MTKTEFIDILEKSLLQLPKSDRDDIVSDYESHFVIGAEKGQSEEDVVAALGDPRELAATYLESLPDGAKGTQATAESEANVSQIPTFKAPNYSGSSKAATHYTPSTASTAKRTPDAGSIVGVVFLSIAALCVLSALIHIWIAIVGIAVGCAFGTLALPITVISFFSSNPLLIAGSVLLGLGLLSFAALAVIGAIAGAKGIIELVKIYIGFCKKLLYGGND